ncbi:MAG: extracellular solute-binding protein [Chloroflexota bacterium]
MSTEHLSSKISRRQMLTAMGVASAGLVAACSAPSPAPGGAATPVPAAKKGQTIKELGPYLANTDVKGEILFPNAWGGARIPLMEEMIADFNTFYPNVKIVNDPVRSPDLDKKLLPALAGGSPPATIMLYSNMMPAYVEQNALQPLDDLIARDELKVDDVFYPGEISTHRYQGKTYSLPQVTAGAWHFVCWHQELLKQAGLDPTVGPKTWSDLDKMADAVKAKVPGVYFFEHTHASSHPMFLVFLYGNNGSFSSEDGKKVAFNTAEGLETLEWMLQFGKRQTKSGKFEEMADRTSSVKDTLTGPVMVSGKYAAFTAGSFSWYTIRTSAPDKKFGYTLFPYNDKNPKAKHRTPVHGGWGFCIPRGIEGSLRDASWEWIKYTCPGEGNHKFVVAQERPSPVRKYNEDPALGANNPHWPIILKDFEINERMPVTGVHPQVLDLIYEMQEEVMFEKAKPQDALKKAAEQSQKVLDEWWAKQK